ncbi:MAG: hypothetical protein KAR87_03400 [Candidatus Aenigmarchaeota archaeon]|nr:hypothetical protein [Candidatus Aenigmarchaeota archaeon]
MKKQDKKLNNTTTELKSSKKEETKTTEKIKEDKTKKKEKSKKKRKSDNLDKVMTIVAVLLLLCAIGGYLILKDKNETEALVEKCFAIQNSPDLQYECKCVPTFLLNRTDTGEYVKKRSKEMCTCSCDIGTGTPYVVELRVAENPDELKQ